MDNIKIGHLIFAGIGTLMYLIFILWGYRKEKAIYEKFNYKAIPTLLYIALIFVVLVLIS